LDVVILLSAFVSTSLMPHLLRIAAIGHPGLSRVKPLSRCHQEQVILQVI
jgi:hypothetical protein